jgi:hypothetical protein
MSESTTIPALNPNSKDREMLEKLIELVFLKEKKYEEKREEIEKARKLRAYRPAVELTWFWQATQAYNRIQKCTHLKGQIGYGARHCKDHNISLHTFPTGESRIKCLSNCGFEVWNRPGWSFKWAYGMKMVESSTNWPSSSQIAPEILKVKTQTNVRIDVAGGARVIYFDKDPV